MLRLWPETVTLCLLPGASWARAGGRQFELESRTDATGESLLAAAGELLDALPIRRKRLKVDIIASDSAAHVLPLAWQPTLTTPQQLQGYARASLLAQGLCAEGQWAVQGAFRHFGQAGLCLAMPTPTIERLCSTLAERGCRLRSVLPFSAAAYWSYRPTRKAGWSLALVCEQARVSALAFDGKAFARMEVEPVSDAVQSSIQRLARRLRASGIAPVALTVWQGSRHEIDEGDLKAMWPDASIAQMDQARWSVR